MATPRPTRAARTDPPAAAEVATVATAGTAPTLDPASPDVVTDRPAAVPLAGSPAAAPVPTDIGAFREGHEGRSGSTDGVHGRGTLVDGDRTEPLARPALADLTEAERAELRRELAEADAAAAGVRTPRPEPVPGVRPFDRGTMTVSCSMKRRRAGLAFGPTPATLDLADLTAEQIRAIGDDPLLTVKIAA